MGYICERVLLFGVNKSFLGSFPTYEKSSLNFQLQAAIVKREAGNNCKGGKCDKRKKKKKKRRNGTKNGNRRNSVNVVPAILQKNLFALKQL